jgi:hypothetical protein
VLSVRFECQIELQDGQHSHHVPKGHVASALLEAHPPSASDAGCLGDLELRSLFVLAGLAGDSPDVVRHPRAHPVSLESRRSCTGWM